MMNLYLSTLDKIITGKCIVYNFLAIFTELKYWNFQDDNFEIHITDFIMWSLNPLSTTTYLNTSWTLLFDIPGRMCVRPHIKPWLQCSKNHFLFLFASLIVVVVGFVRSLWHKHTNLLFYFQHFLSFVRQLWSTEPK